MGIDSTVQIAKFQFYGRGSIKEVNFFGILWQTYRIGQ